VPPRPYPVPGRPAGRSGQSARTRDPGPNRIRVEASDLTGIERRCGITGRVEVARSTAIAPAAVYLAVRHAAAFSARRWRSWATTSARSTPMSR
jgi:hypothetical protein